MAYNDYGAFVYHNGQRRPDKEDAPAYASNEEAFGMKDISKLSSGSKIFANILATRDVPKQDAKQQWIKRIHHGILGDGPIRVVCHKQGLPEIYDFSSGECEKVSFCDEEEIDPYEYDPINFEYKGYTFNFRAESPYVAYMEEPDGSWWRCEYDYSFGAGFEDSQ